LGIAGEAKQALPLSDEARRGFEEAQQKVLKAIACKVQFGHASEPWKSGNTLADIKIRSNTSGANQKAIAAEGPAVIQALLQQRITDPSTAHLLTFIQALQATVGGSCERRVADATDLNYSISAEILLPIETLENSDA